MTGYIRGGHTVEIARKITTQDLREIERVLDRPPQRHKEWAEHYVFGCEARDVGRLTKLLRDRTIAHTLTVELAWTP